MPYNQRLAEILLCTSGISYNIACNCYMNILLCGLFLLTLVPSLSALRPGPKYEANKDNTRVNTKQTKAKCFYSMTSLWDIWSSKLLSYHPPYRTDPDGYGVIGGRIHNRRKMCGGKCMENDYSCNLIAKIIFHVTSILSSSMENEVRTF